MSTSHGRLDHCGMAVGCNLHHYQYLIGPISSQFNLKSVIVSLLHHFTIAATKSRTSKHQYNAQTEQLGRVWVTLRPNVNNVYFLYCPCTTHIPQIYVRKDIGSWKNVYFIVIKPYCNFCYYTGARIAILRQDF